MKVIGHVPVAVPSELVTTKFASVVQLSEMVKPAASNCETEVIAIEASVIEQPVSFTVVKVPVTTGAVVSLILIICVTVVALLQASLIVYVLVKVIGHVPVAVPSELVTTKFASAVQLSEMVNPAVSNAVTVVIADGAAAIEQPSVFEAVKFPVTTGAIVSLILIICVTVVALLQASVIVYVLVKVIGHVPVAVPSELVTTKFASAVQLSEIVKPAVSNAVTVVIADGAAAIEQPSVFEAVKVPVTTGAVVSLMLIV